MSDNKNPQNVKNTLCYIPIVAFVLYFTEEKKTKEFETHIRYGMVLFGVFIVLTLFLRSIFLWVLFLVYLGISAYLSYKAYIWEDVKIGFIDDIFEKMFKKEKKEEDKKEDELILEEK